METKTHRRIALAALPLAIFAAFAINGPSQPSQCDPTRVTSLEGGLAYAEAFAAGRFSTGADTTMADENVAVTQAALDEARAQCGARI